MKKEFPFELVDLSYAISANMPLWPGDTETRQINQTSIKQESYYLQAWQIGEHTGTHVGVPSHFAEKGKSVNEYKIDELLHPLVIVPLKNAMPNRALSISDIEVFERENGKILDGSVLALNTGWSKRWPDPEMVFERNKAGDFFYPGFSVECTQWLIEERKISGLGTDAPGIDPGNDTEFKSGHLLAEKGKFHLENLANLEKLPTNGVWILIGALKLAEGSGSPSRVFGFIPK